MTKRIFGFFPIAFLAACSSGGGGDANSPFASFVAATQAIADNNGYESFGSFDNYSDPAMIPPGGNAEYDGYVALYLEGNPVGVDGSPSTIPNPSHIGRADLTVNFGEANNYLTGSATEFYDETNEEAYTGSLTFANGQQNPGQNEPFDPAWEVDIDGSLTSPGGMQYDIDASAGGVFVGPALDGIAGIIEGDVTVSGETSSFVGAYLAE